MSSSVIRYYCYPRTESPPAFAEAIVEAFRENESKIATVDDTDGLKSDAVLASVRPELENQGFEVETGKSEGDRIYRPVLFGENGEPMLQYEVDGYHEGWRCGLEVEAGRAWKGNAIYRDLIQAIMMVRVDTLALAVPIEYSYSGRTNRAFEKTNNVVETLYNTTRFESPYRLILIGY